MNACNSATLFFGHNKTPQQIKIDAHSVEHYAFGIAGGLHCMQENHTQHNDKLYLRYPHIVEVPTMETNTQHEFT